MLAALILNLLLAGPTQGQPVPQPFPRPGAPPVQTPGNPTQPGPGTPSSAAGLSEAPPSEATLGIPVYPGAQFIASYNAGRNQRYYLFGTSAGFVELVTYYRNLLKQRGEQVYEVPATHTFDIGRFDDELMAFPPGVTIKDFQSELSQGFPNPKPGGQPARFPTIVQIVPFPGNPGK
jgi:hypothetical protein